VTSSILRIVLNRSAVEVTVTHYLLLAPLPLDFDFLLYRTTSRCASRARGARHASARSVSLLSRCG
jgi:hypothetical protein